jgi:uncharacterized protein (TIGR03435 family)
MRWPAAMLAMWLVNPVIAQQFDVVSVKPSAPGARERIAIQPGGRFVAEGVSLKLLIAAAWQLQGFQMAGGENWTTGDRWTIEAQSEGAVDAPTWVPPFFPEVIAVRVRALLADRFELRTHRENRELPVYRLSFGGDGSKLKVGGSPGPAPGAVKAGPGIIVASAISMQQLVTLLGRLMDRPIIDRTSLTGNFDVNLRFAPDTAPRPSPLRPQADGAPPPSTDDPSIFTALDEQLGLKLEPAKESVDVLVIDSATKPTAN